MSKEEQAAKKRAFCDAYRRFGRLSAAAKAIAVSTGAHYNWLRSDEAYREMFAQARRDSADRLEEVARERAIRGMRRLKFDRNGKPLKNEHGEIYEEWQPSDVLLIFLLKANAPEKFGDKVTQVGPIEYEHRVSVETVDDWYGESAADVLASRAKNPPTESDGSSSADPARSEPVQVTSVWPPVGQNGNGTNGHH